MSDAHSTSRPILEVRNLKVQFQVRGEGQWPWSPKRFLKAVDGVSFDLRAGETLGIVGESGCGKSTLARALIDLVPIADGSVRWQGDEMRGAGPEAWQAKRKVVVVGADRGHHARGHRVRARRDRGAHSSGPITWASR